MNACRSCGALVVWLTIRPGGRQMPVDAEPVAEGTILADLDKATGIVLSSGALVLVRADTPEEPLYRSHFASCPHASRWRRPT